MDNTHIYQLIARRNELRADLVIADDRGDIIEVDRLLPLIRRINDELFDLTGLW